MQYFANMILAGLAVASAVVALPRVAVPGVHFGNGTAPFRNSTAPASNSTVGIGYGNGTDTRAHGNETATLTPQVIVEAYKNWTNATCYWDLYADDRQLHVRTSPPLDYHNMTVNVCLDYCDQIGHKFSGVEFGGECYCDNTRPSQHWVGGTCDMACTGDNTQVCGGHQSLLVYEKSC